MKRRFYNVLIHSILYILDVYQLHNPKYIFLNGKIGNSYGGATPIYWVQNAMGQKYTPRSEAHVRYLVNLLC